MQNIIELGDRWCSNIVKKCYLSLSTFILRVKLAEDICEEEKIYEEERYYKPKVWESYWENIHLPKLLEG